MTQLHTPDPEQQNPHIIPNHVKVLAPNIRYTRRTQ